MGLDEARLGSIGRHFDRYVEDRRLPGFLVVVTRAGKVAYVVHHGFRDLENRAPVEADTCFRIYSMTKPITSVAAMICYEEGLIALDDPLSNFIPEFAETRVFSGGVVARAGDGRLAEPIRIWHLMTHTAGLTYGWMSNHPVDAMYRSAGFDWDTPRDLDLAGCCGRLAKLPLRCQPGTEWNYSVATDVLGRVVEVASGQALEQFFAERILGPLAMNETGFFVEGEAEQNDWPRSTAPTSSPGGPRGPPTSARRRCTGRGRLSAAAASSRRRPTTTASPRCCCAAGSSTACGSSVPGPSRT